MTKDATGMPRAKRNFMCHKDGKRLHEDNDKMKGGQGGTWGFRWQLFQVYMEGHNAKRLAVCAHPSTGGLALGSGVEGGANAAHANLVVDAIANDWSAPRSVKRSLAISGEREGRPTNIPRVESSAADTGFSAPGLLQAGFGNRMATLPSLSTTTVAGGLTGAGLRESLLDGSSAFADFPFDDAVADGDGYHFGALPTDGEAVDDDMGLLPATAVTLAAVNDCLSVLPGDVTGSEGGPGFQPFAAAPTVIPGFGAITSLESTGGPLPSLAGFLLSPPCHGARAAALLSPRNVAALGPQSTPTPAAARGSDGVHVMTPAFAPPPGSTPVSITNRIPARGRPAPGSSPVLMNDPVLVAELIEGLKHSEYHCG